MQAASASSPAISIAATGLNAGNRLVLSDLRTTGATSSDGIAMAVTPCNFLHFERVTSVGNSNGIHFGVSAGSANDVEIDDCVLSSNSNVGLRVASAMSSTTALSVTGGEMKLNNVNGFGFNPSILATCFGDDFTIDGTVFADNGSIIAGNGTGHVSLAGFNGSAMLKDLTMSGTAFVPIQLRGKTPSAPLGTVAFQNVVVSGSTPRPAVYIQVYTSLANLSFTGLNLSGMSSSNAPGGLLLERRNDPRPHGSERSAREHDLPLPGRRLCRSRHGQHGRRDRELRDGVQRRDDARAEGSVRPRRERRSPASATSRSTTPTHPFRRWAARSAKAARSRSP